MRIFPAVPWLLCLTVLSTAARAGDAVVVGYNPDGLWTAITYYRSSTPKGGDDYKDAARAREEALRDLRKRAGENMVMSKVVGESDASAYVAVARGEIKGADDVIVAAHGESQAEANRKALADLSRAGATANQKIVYRFFSYGADSTGKK